MKREPDIEWIWMRINNNRVGNAGPARRERVWGLVIDVMPIVRSRKISSLTFWW